MRTSYSAIGTYLQCPQKYKFQEVDRIRVPKGREAIFGTLVHNTLKFMFQRDPLFPTLDEVVAHFRAHWPSHEVFAAETKHDPLKRAWNVEEEKAYFEEGVRMLKKFYEKNAPWNYTVVDLESRFEVALSDEKSGETHILAGIIDRIDKLPDGTYEIIDYKTAKRMPSQAALDRDLQLSLYSLGLQKRWPHLVAEDIKLSLYFLKHGEKLSTRAAPETTEEIKTRALKTIAEIQEKLRLGKEFEPMPSALCNWCGYRPLCPAWRHLYRNKEKEEVSQEEIDRVIGEYFEIKGKSKEYDVRLSDLQNQIKDYMRREKVTRVFGKEGIISQKIIQRYAYDWQKVKELLTPLGKWEAVLDADEAKLKKVLREIPEEIQHAIAEMRTLAKEFIVLNATLKKPEDETPAKN